MWDTYLQPATLDQALELLQRHAAAARIIAGGTDVLVELRRGVQPTTTLIDISALHDLKYIHHRDDSIRLGALATHNDVSASPTCGRFALPLAQACCEVGAPQIRTRATVAGNVITASPANDTITPLVALGAEVVLAGVNGERLVPLCDFYAGVRRTMIRPNELLREIRIPAMGSDQRGMFLKLGLRRAQAIAVINVALVLTFDGDIVRDARIALGAVAPVIVRASQAEAYLLGRRLDPAACDEAGRLAGETLAPITDVRATAAYRLATVAALVTDGLRRIAAGTEAVGWTDRPVLLDTGGATTRGEPFAGTITTTINGRRYTLPHAQHKTLLHALREEAGLTGAKEGCAEGECGACTVWLNGQAVMSCLVLAAQAHNAALTTIEGLASAHDLHPLQRSFIARGAVQCGYCIPGVLMAGAKLLEERPHPGPDEIRVALSGNLCRCTGYRQILDAVRVAGAGGAP
jgi:carbon-monoxide dehydrogenase medium subunit